MRMVHHRFSVARHAWVAALAALASCAAAVPAASAVSASSVNTGDLAIGTDGEADSMLVDVQRDAPEIRVGLRYATSENFTGAPLPGYEGNHAWLRREAAAALVRVARHASAEGYVLQVFDAYRPVRATLAMVAWTERTGRTDLLRDGYIASRSRHNLGLAIDLTLLDRASGLALPMGTAFDEFSTAAHTANATGTALANRRVLQRLMQAEGFVNYDQEWWHYSYAVENPVRYDRVIH